jgi:hypothetical protein
VFQQAARRPRDLNSDACAETIFGCFEALNVHDDPGEADKI